MDGILTAINDFFRGILFSFAQCFLFIFDVVWEIVKRIATLDISGVLYKWFILIIILIGLFLVFRVFKIWMKTMFDEDYRSRLNIPQMLIKLLLASFAIGFTPFAFSFVSELTVDFINHVEYFVPTNSDIVNELKPSTVLLEAGRINISDVNGDLGPEISVTDNFDVNAKDENDHYLYFVTYTSLFLLVVESVAGCFIFLLICIMIGQRLFSIAYKYLLAPYPISGLIDHEDKSFATWMKMLLGDFMMNFAQIYGVYLTIILCNNASIQQMLGNDAVGICAKIIFFLAGLIAVLNLPTVISTIIGGHGAGALQSLQELKTIMTMSTAMTSGVAGATVGVGLGALGGAVGGIGNAYQENHEQGVSGKSGMSNMVKSGVAGAMIGTGQTMKTNFTGGKMGGGVTAGARILKSGVQAAKGGSGTNTGSLQGKYNFINGGSLKGTSGDGSAFDNQPTEKQIHNANQLGIDNPESYSQGELSMMLQESDASQSYWDGSEQGDNFKTNSKNSDYEQSSGFGKSSDIDMSAYTPKTTDHSTNLSGEKIYADTLRGRLQEQKIDSPKKETLLNGKPLKK